MSKQKLELGFEGRREPVEVEVPDGQPIPWDARAELVRVGVPTPRVDGPKKVRGDAKYTTDIRLPGMLYAEVVRSPHPAAVVASIDVEHAKKLPGVKAVHLVGAQDVRYEGQEVAAVAAETIHQARDAARSIAQSIRWEVQPHVIDLDRALAPGAPLVHRGPPAPDVKGNLRGPLGKPEQRVAGDVGKGLAEAEQKVVVTFETQVQTHSALEPHCSVVRPTPEGGFEVWTSTQGIQSVLQDLSQVFSIPASKVRVHCDVLGGGFGAKFGGGTYTMIAAHLARAAKRPVRLVLDRRSEHLAGGNRPSSRQKVELGAKKNGKLTAISLLSHGTAGVGTGAGVGRYYHSVYDLCENRRVEEYDVFTHAGPGAAFRAPGHPQACFALEGAVDELARRLGMNPIDLRLANDSHPVRRSQWALARERFGFDALWKKGPRVDGPMRRGVGCASSVWYNIVQPNVGAIVEINSDGSVVLSSAVQDIGGGIRTVIAQVVAEVLGIEVAAIDARIGDSQWPEGPGSGGSKTTASLTPAVREAAEEAKKKLAERLAPKLGAEPAALIWKGGRVEAPNGKGMAFKDAAKLLKGGKISGHGERKPDLAGINGAPDPAMHKIAKLIAGVQLAEVAVDVETGIVRVERVLAVHDAGRIMNDLLAKSQVNGGVIQGVGYALYEERILDPLTGGMLNANLESYRIPGVKDLPAIDVVLNDVYSGLSSTGAMGLGEPATVPTAAAVANAVSHALGLRITRLPMTPERVLAAIAASKKGGGA